MLGLLACSRSTRSEAGLVASVSLRLTLSINLASPAVAVIAVLYDGGVIDTGRGVAAVLGGSWG